MNPLKTSGDVWTINVRIMGLLKINPSSLAVDSPIPTSSRVLSKN